MSQVVSSSRMVFGLGHLRSPSERSTLDANGTEQNHRGTSRPPPATPQRYILCRCARVRYGHPTRLAAIRNVLMVQKPHRIFPILIKQSASLKTNICRFLNLSGLVCACF